ncbi:MAG TPA: MarR family transcriptional regulator [Pseudonocardiaceae bacterium]|nr:MarR family transcriptional regulator [Pseudonocardiaceae bacterium]
MPELSETDLLRAGCDLRVVLGRIVRRLRQHHAPGELTLSEVSVLSRLDRYGPATPGALADDERVRPQAMGATLAVLEQRALVNRAADPHDGRRALMSVNADGRRLLVDRRSANSQRMATALTEGFSREEQRQLIAVIPLLERMADTL